MEKFEARRDSRLNSEAETLTSFSNATHHSVPGAYYPLIFLRSTSKGW